MKKSDIQEKLKDKETGLYGLFEVLVKKNGIIVEENYILENKEKYLVMGIEIPKLVELKGHNTSKVLNERLIKMELSRYLKDLFNNKIELKEIIKKQYGYEYIGELKKMGSLLIEGNKNKIKTNYSYHIKTYVVFYNSKLKEVDYIIT